MEEGFKDVTLSGHCVGHWFLGHVLLCSVLVAGVLCIRDVDPEFLSPVVVKVLHLERRILWLLVAGRLSPTV
jgi:hypothetical protein